MQIVPSSIDESVENLVRRIEISTLPEDEKSKLYAMIGVVLESAALPSLLSAMPQNKVQELAKYPETDTPQKRVDILADALKNESTNIEATALMQTALQGVDLALVQSGI